MLVIQKIISEATAIGNIHRRRILREGFSLLAFRNQLLFRRRPKLASPARVQPFFSGSPYSDSFVLQRVSGFPFRSETARISCPSA